MTQNLLSPHDLVWFRCQLWLTPTFVNHKAHPLIIIEAIVKGISELSQTHEQLRLSFSVRGQTGYRLRLKRDKAICIEVVSACQDQAVLQRWLDTARCYFDPEQPGKNFHLTQIGAWQEQSISWLPIMTLTQRELCWNATTPLPFKPNKGKSRTWLDFAQFRHLIEKRLQRFFNKEQVLPDADMQLLPYYWEYAQIPHQSHSQQGHVKYINGCVGKLYLRAPNSLLKTWLPWLVLIDQIGVGTELSFGRGRGQLLVDAPTYFLPTLINPSAIAHTLSEVIERYDQALPMLANTATGLDESRWAIEMSQQIQQGYRPQPFACFYIPKGNGKFRLIEKPALTDLVMLSHLHTQLRDLLDLSFEEESIGFRKGMSRQLAIDRIHEAVQDGFTTVFESDISDFFPSIDHDILLTKLDSLLPDSDQLLRHLLGVYLKAPQLIEGRVVERHKGLPMGSPLSPLLANVYLDAFDKHIKSFGVKLIRYADDFVILTRSQAIAESLLDDTLVFLQDLALSINLEKTAIRSIDEGFTFLGIHFGGDEQTTLNLAASVDSLRKPLYVNEAFTYLGVDGDALEVRKGNHILSRIPLKRISEILTLAPVSWSSALVAKCNEANLPIVITGGNGRAIATFAGDSARRYDMAYRQGCTFHDMSETDRLAIAVSIAQTKLDNSIDYVKQRYRTGTNQVLNKLVSLRDHMSAAPDIHSVRGYEGAAAKLYFSLFNEWISQPGFEWQGRKRRPADRINSLLNFGYHLLFSRLNVLVRGEGLNPYLSFLHEPTERYESFVSDIQEVFRVHIDRLVIKLINNKMIGIQDFTENDAGAWLSASGKEAFLSAYARMLEHRPTKTQLSLNESMALQVHNWAGFMTEGKTLQLYNLSTTRK